MIGFLKFIIIVVITVFCYRKLSSHFSKSNNGKFKRTILPGIISFFVFSMSCGAIIDNSSSKTEIKKDELSSRNDEILPKFDGDLEFQCHINNDKLLTVYTATADKSTHIIISNSLTGETVQDNSSNSMPINYGYESTPRVTLSFYSSMATNNIWMSVFRGANSNNEVAGITFTANGTPDIKYCKDKAIASDNFYRGESVREPASSELLDSMYNIVTPLLN